MTLQVTDCATTLGSVHRMVEAGNRVVFDVQGSYILNKGSGKITPIENRNGSYEFDLWVKAPPRVQAVPTVKTQNKFEALSSREEHEVEDFARRDIF